MDGAKSVKKIDGVGKERGGERRECEYDQIRFNGWFGSTCPVLLVRLKLSGMVVHCFSGPVQQGPPIPSGARRGQEAPISRCKITARAALIRPGMALILAADAPDLNLQLDFLPSLNQRMPVYTLWTQILSRALLSSLIHSIHGRLAEPQKSATNGPGTTSRKPGAPRHGCGSIIADTYPSQESSWKTLKW